MPARVCLVSMPFTPVSTPGLGVSMLKAAVQRVGAPCDVYYGALDFFRFVCSDEPESTALYDYNFIASNQQLGDLLFAPLLWETSDDDVRAALKSLAGHKNYLFRTEELAAVAARIQKYASRLKGFLGHCFEAREWRQYTLVGFSSTFSQNIGSLAFARMLRRRCPDVHIVFGGANCDGEMGLQLLESFPYVDAVVQGEAEESFPEYVTRFIGGADCSDVPGVVLRCGGELVARRPAQPVADMDALPLPDFDDYYDQLPPALRSAENRRQCSLPVETSRGCWWGAVHHCIFCGLNPTTMAFRAKTPERAVAEIRQLTARYGVTRVTAVDNIISKKYFTSVLPELEGAGLDIFYETKANLTEDQVRALARAGVRSIQPGIEGLSSEILALMDKGVHGYQNLELLKWCATYGLEPIWFYLYRFPGESHAPYFRDAARMRRWVHLPPPRNPNPVVIDRYSPLYTRREEFGLKNLRPGGYSSACYRGLSENARMRICYHFEADLPQGNDLPYEIPLWEAISGWNRAYQAGARLYQFRSPSSTLIVDTRSSSFRSFLMTECADRTYRALRQGRGAEALARNLDEIESGQQEPHYDDFELAYLAGLLGARPLTKTPGRARLGEFLRALDEEALADCIDGRWLALAVDCTDIAAAERIGLRKFARVLDELERPAARLFEALGDMELIQILESSLHDS